MSQTRRKIIKTAGAAITVFSPVVTSVLLPAHGQTSAVNPCCDIDGQPRVPIDVVNPDIEQECHDCEGVKLPWKETECQGWRTEGGECVPENPSPKPKPEPEPCGPGGCKPGSPEPAPIEDPIVGCLGTGCAGQPLTGE